MRRHLSQLMVWGSVFLAIAAFSFSPRSAKAQVNVNISAGVNFSAGLAINSAQDFYDPLAGYGAWFDMPPYGRVWQPADVDPSWRPYEVGHWEWTDVGWYWVSDEPWAWATYHYGSWTDDPNYGWLWIPGTTWAPAWVVWRQSPDYIGWAPCGPNGLVLPAPLFCFVDIHRFHNHFGPRDFIVNNTTIINRTRVINNFRTVDRTFGGGERRRVVMNEGPSVSIVDRAVGTRFTQRPVRDIVTQEPAPATVQRRGSDLNIQRPALRENATATTANSRDRQPIRRGSQQQGTRIQGNSQSSGPSRQEQQNISPVSPTGRDQQQTFPQPGRQPGVEQPRVTQPIPQTTPPRTSREGTSQSVTPAQPPAPTSPSRARPEEGPTQRPSQYQPAPTPSPRERSPERTPPGAVNSNRGTETQPAPRTVEPRPTPPAQERSPQVDREVRPPPQTLPPPTGREQPRIYPPREQAPSTPVPERRPESAVRDQPQRVTPVTPPPVRERPQESTKEQAPPERPAPEHPSPPARPEQPSKDHDRDRDHP